MILGIGSEKQKFLGKRRRYSKS